MTKLASPFLTTTLSLVSGVALAVEINTQSNNGQADSPVDVGQVTLDTHENVAPNSVDNNNTNSDGTMLHPNGLSASREEVIRDRMYRDTMCEDDRCPDVNKKVETGNNINNNAETRTSDTTQ